MRTVSIGDAPSSRSRLFGLAAILGLAACARGETSLTDHPLHFAALLDRTVTEGSELPPESSGARGVALRA
jgi:hypothetical protein